MRETETKVTHQYVNFTNSSVARQTIAHKMGIHLNEFAIEPEFDESLDYVEALCAEKAGHSLKESFT